MDRYQKLFSTAESKGEGIFMPFLVLGDPDPATSLKIIEGLVENGADALELGFPFSDPIADGPVIQRAGQCALGAGVRQEDCFRIIKKIREKFASLPIGLLVYANLVLARGMEAFFLTAKKAGVDSVLIADVPLMESAPFRRAAEQAGIHLVLVLPLHAGRETVASVAGKSAGLLVSATSCTPNTKKNAPLSSAIWMKRRACSLNIHCLVRIESTSREASRGS